MGWRGSEQKRQRPVRRAAARPGYAYYSSGKEREAEKTIDLSSSSRLRLLPTYLAIAAIILSLLFSLTLTTKPGLTYSQGQASPYREPEEYTAEVDNILKSKLGYRTKLTINTSEVEQALLSKFPELKAAVLRLPVLGRKPTLVVEVSPPALIITSATKSLVLDDSGVAISEVAALSEEAKQGLPVVQDQSGVDLTLGKQIVTSETVSFIRTAIGHLRAQSTSVSQLTLPVAANQLDIRISGENYYIKTDVSGDARLQIGSFLAVRDHLAAKGQKANEYIDVRVEEKVFYK